RARPAIWRRRKGGDGLRDWVDRIRRRRSSGWEDRRRRYVGGAVRTCPLQPQWIARPRFRRRRPACVRRRKLSVFADLPRTRRTARRQARRRGDELPEFVLLLFRRRSL